MHHLEVPQALACLRVQRNEAVREEIRAGSVSAVVRRRRSRRRHVHDPGLFVGAQAAPRAHVTGPLRRAVTPGVVTELALAGQDVECPKMPTGANVEAAHVFGQRLFDLATVTGRADDARDDDDLPDHDRAEAPSESLRPTGTQENPATLSEVRQETSGRRVERVQVRLTDQDDAPISPFAPKLDTSVRPPTDLFDGRFERLLDPQRSASARIEGLDEPERIGSV